MPWKEQSVFEQRREFVVLARHEGGNISRLCERYGISRKTGYRWLSRARGSDGDEEALQNRSRRPRHSPRQSPPSLEEAVLALRERHPAWGGRKISHVLARDKQVLVAPSTVTHILHCHGRIDAARSQAAQPWQRFEHEAPNQLWQMDFKGHFETGFGRCHPLTVLDDHSRYLLCLKACTNEKRETVQAGLVDVFGRYGLPERMTMDNGSPWGDTGTSANWTVLELWLRRQGIRVGHSRPSHPQTQGLCFSPPAPSRGRMERLHATLASEVLQGRYFVDMPQVERAFGRWREDYNQQRPHEALGQKPPITRYRPSPRSYNPSPPPPEYDASMQVRRVSDNAQVSFKNNIFKVGKAFIRESIGIREEKDEGTYSLWWYSTKIGSLDLKNHNVCLGKSS